MPTGEAGDLHEDAGHVSACLAPMRKLALLEEWHASLTAIVAREPDAAETLKTIADIERQIDELMGEKISGTVEPDLASGVYCP
jgi:hypothetical protein